MAIQKTEAVLLKKKDLRETSLILTFFTRDFGKIHGVLKGARGSRARSGANPLFFSLDHVVFYEKKKSDLFIISQCDAHKTFLNILRDWERASVAYYILELTDVFTEPGESVKPVFLALLNSLVLLDGNKDPCVIARLFEVKFLMAMGLWPSLEDLELSKGSLSTLACFENDSWQAASKINLTRDVGEEIKKITNGIIADNLDRPLKTTAVFK